MIAIAVIVFSGSSDSGATGTAAGPLASHQARESVASPRVAPGNMSRVRVPPHATACVAQEECARSGAEQAAVTTPTKGREMSTRPSAVCSARRAVRFYAGRIAYWRSKMGAAAGPKGIADHRSGCPQYLAHVLQRKAYAAHRAYDRWLRDEYHWQRWLPRLWYAIGQCETGLNWHFDSGTYVSAFGIIRSAFPGWNGNNSPREQYRVALGIAGRYGLGAWGCYSHGGYRYHM